MCLCTAHYTLHSCLMSQYLLQSLNSLTNCRQYLQAICLTAASQERENWTCIRSTTRQQKTCPSQTLPCPNPCPRWLFLKMYFDLHVLWIITTWTRLFIQKNKWPPTIDYRLIIETDTSWRLTHVPGGVETLGQCDRGAGERRAPQLPGQGHREQNGECERNSQ